MKIMVIAIGVAGDVFPLVGLGRALHARGHEVHVAASPGYQGAIEKSGLRFHALEGIPGTAGAVDLYHPTRSMHVVAERLLIPAIKPVYELLATLNSQDWIVMADAHTYGARMAQEKHGFHLTTCLVSPFSLRTVERMPITSRIEFPLWLPLLFRRAFFAFVARLWDRELAPAINTFRAGLRMPPVKDIRYQWSLSPDRVIGLFPEWFAPRCSDWPKSFVYGGFMVFDQGITQEMPVELREPGDPLVIFAAGSAGQIANTFFQNAVTASSMRSWRAVLLTGQGSHWDDVPLPKNVLRYSYVPLSQLLPRSSLIVHHGGLGTISLAVATGVPQIVIPFGHDQFDHAARIEHLGVGQRLLTSPVDPQQLGTMIEKMLKDPSWSARCRLLASQTAADTSLTSVCKLIESDLT